MRKLQPNEDLKGSLTECREKTRGKRCLAGRDFYVKTCLHNDGDVQIFAPARKHSFTAANRTPHYEFLISHLNDRTEAPPARNYP